MSKNPSMMRALADMSDRRQPPPWTKIDSGIRHAVRVLWEFGVETCQSCEGGPGHPFQEPTVQFLGGPAEGPRALGIAMQHGLRVVELRRVWLMQDGEPTGPTWHMTFVAKPKAKGRNR